ncbi:two-component regulator propeller domain-containing protein [Altibacter sp.]|mgnify:CR=1 FL=1|uniref:ligand-binding sensor domain-containing protein n=1 Tax=Altibacter sp. TaxID=2024823 RepID=UPI0025BF964D|nr:two-component regulator propeller domain-containing protein [Altibacter sp.]
MNLLLVLTMLSLLVSCNGQPSSTKKNFDLSRDVHRAHGDAVNELGNSIMVVYQDKKDVYWFGSWETGVYRYDGKEVVNYTTKHGLLNNRIDEIQEDKEGNKYFVSANTTAAISKFDGTNFTTLNAVPSENWTLEPTDLWFKYSYGNTRKVYRYDGSTLFELTLPYPQNLSNPFDVYSIYKDRKGAIWFGTNPVGVCRYDGKFFQWITEEDVTEFRNEGANGVRSILEDKYGDFWFNTEYRYSIYDSTTLQSGKFYTRHKGIGGLDGKEDSHLDEYLSSVKDDSNNLWFVTYLDGVWKYDGTKITHYTVQENSQNISLFSIYKDNHGELWLGTHENGVYKFNGTTFEKFTVENGKSTNAH